MTRQQLIEAHLLRVVELVESTQCLDLPEVDQLTANLSALRVNVGILRELLRVAPRPGRQAPLK